MPYPGLGGSRGFSCLVAIHTPMPISTMTPTRIHCVGTLSKYAAMASPTMRMMKPMRYVAKDDMPGRTAIMVRDHARERLDARYLLGLSGESNDRRSRDEHGRSMLQAESLGVLAARQPNVQVRSADLPSGVVDEKATVVLLADV